MSLELRKNSRSFYSRLSTNGQRQLFTLKTQYEGTPPKGLKMKKKGDRAFEASRDRAKEEERELREKLLSPVGKAAVLKKIYELQTGDDLLTLKIPDIWSLAKGAIREKEHSEKYAMDLKRILRLFEDYIREDYPHVQYAHSVNREMAEGFLRNQLRSGRYSGKTVNNHKSALRAAFGIALRYDRVFQNPFQGIEDVKEPSEHRRPFTLEELSRILEVARPDPLMYPLIVVGATTAMRLGDCCCLEWASVNWKIQQIQVPAVRKTMAKASIPFFGLLESVLMEAKANHPGSRYAFPEAAQYYEGGMQDVFHARFARILLNAGFTDDENPETSIRLTRKGSKGPRRSSIRGFHSLKTTWVTLALMNGIPIEVVKHITGNQVTEVVLEHYFNPNLQAMRDLVKERMPGLFTEAAAAPANGERVTISQAAKLVTTLNETNWRQCKAELLRILA